MKIILKTPLQKGELTELGYSVKNTSDMRRKALYKAVRKYGAVPVMRKLNLIAVYNRNMYPKYSKIYNSDKKWVRRTYYELSSTRKLSHTVLVRKDSRKVSRKVSHKVSRKVLGSKDSTKVSRKVLGRKDSTKVSHKVSRKVSRKILGRKDSTKVSRKVLGRKDSTKVSRKVLGRKDSTKVSRKLINKVA
jgi:hypothetical protein